MASLNPRLKMALDMGGVLVDAAEATLRAVQRARETAGRTRRGATLRPGTGTPLWNELTASLRGVNWKYGEKARLGRILGVPRQRVDDYLDGRSQPDAERTLLLLHWLAARLEGRDLG